MGNITKEAVMIFVEPIAPQADLVAQQYDLEKGMRFGGIERYERSQARSQEYGRETDTDYGNILVARLHEPLVAALDALVAEKESGKAGPKGALYKTLKVINDNHAVAFLTLRAVITRLISGTTVTAVSRLIGDMLEDEARLREVRAQDAFAFEMIQSGANSRVSYNNKREYVRRAIARTVPDASWQDWSEKDRLTIGGQCLEMLMPLGLVEKVQTGSKEDTVLSLVATAETLAFIEKRGKAASILNPMREPMIVTPTPWGGPIGGGYMTREVPPLKLVRGAFKEQLAALGDADLSEVFDSLNAAQDSAWSVNPFTLTVVQMLFEMNLPVGGIPRRYDEELPVKPHDIDTNEEARIQWRRDAADVHAARITTRTKRLAFIATVNTATRYSMFPAIYFPYNLDFRGRMYACCPFNPQGPDMMKGLLRFSEGKPLGEDGSIWLAIHLANCADAKTPDGKTSKLPLEERVMWVYAHEDAILACAADPVGNLWWADMDQPISFLAACREWAGWVAEGENFVSHLPIALDGSCSGTQHFSMALRDEVGGAAVNLVPCDKPADIYTLVLERVIEKVKEDANSDKEDVATFATQWLASGLLVRSTVKRGVMTFSYGSKAYGFREQLIEDILEPTFKEVRIAQREGRDYNWPFERRGAKAAGYLAKVLYAAVSSTVKKSAEAMDWLASAAKVTASEGLRVRWHTPDGLPVVQPYVKTKDYRIDTALNGSRIRMSMVMLLNEVNPTKQASAMAPNYVHSLDATHLRMTVRGAVAEGMKHFALIHDSFGVHAADTGRFFTLLRETIVKMYSETDVLNALREELLDQVRPESREQIKPLPAPGTLDISRVTECDFAFA